MENPQLMLSNFKKKNMDSAWTFHARHREGHIKSYLQSIYEITFVASLVINSKNLIFLSLYL